ncbi:MAG: YeeE/YedE family protein [Bacteroidales bacterium]|nr:YeeE/YedE family protein [Bacteroidales bacterium]
MGPLIPQGFVNPDLNLFFAFVIGLGFGYVLEQAGFSSSRKLAGVFYGYDFVVLRVFFTAATTAMTGLLLFNYIGWIDYSMLYINPMFVWSAIIGGVIMGLGFILGGFCPGTSLTAAVIGKIDAMFFIGGMFIGIFIFGQFYDTFEAIYLGNNLGGIFVYESLGMSREWFAMILILVALLAFVITQKIEDSVNDTPRVLREARPSHMMPAMLMILAGFVLLILPSQPRSNWKETGADKILAEMASKQHFTCPDEIAFSIMQGDKYPVLLVDVRDPTEFERFTLPGAINIPLAEILQRKWETVFENPDLKIALFSFSDTHAEEAWLIARRAGYENIKVLEGGLNNFLYSVFIEEVVPERQRPDCLELHTVRFRENAKNYFQSGQAIKMEDKSPVPVIKVVEIEMPASGGC